MKKLILHLCADIGSDSYFYQNNPDYEVELIGEKIGVENYSTSREVYGIIANPVCTEFSTAKSFSHVGNLEKGMFLVNHCLRIIKETKPKFWVIENPFNGRLKEILGNPDAVYQPWQYGSPWTKKQLFGVILICLLKFTQNGIKYLNLIYTLDRREINRDLYISTKMM